MIYNVRLNVRVWYTSYKKLYRAIPACSSPFHHLNMHLLKEFLRYCCSVTREWSPEKVFEPYGYIFCRSYELVDNRISHYLIEITIWLSFSYHKVLLPTKGLSNNNTHTVCQIVHFLLVDGCVIVVQHS